MPLGCEDKLRAITITSLDSRCCCAYLLLSHLAAVLGCLPERGPWKGTFRRRAED